MKERWPIKHDHECYIITSYAMPAKDGGGEHGIWHDGNQQRGRER